MFAVKLNYCCSPKALLPLKQDISFYRQEEARAAAPSGDEIRL